MRRPDPLMPVAGVPPLAITPPLSSAAPASDATSTRIASIRDFGTSLMPSSPRSARLLVVRTRRAQLTLRALHRLPLSREFHLELAEIDGDALAGRLQRRRRARDAALDLRE